MSNKSSRDAHLPEDVPSDYTDDVLVSQIEHDSFVYNNIEQQLK